MLQDGCFVLLLPCRETHTILGSQTVKAAQDVAFQAEFGESLQ